MNEDDTLATVIFMCNDLVLCSLVTGQVPASLVAERLGSKTTFGFAILAPSILTLLVSTLNVDLLYFLISL